MRVFVAYGYNDRDAWIEAQVLTILRSIGFAVFHDKAMHGQELKDEVRRRLDMSDAAIGFLTLRDGQGDADYTSHLWVRDAMVHAIAKGRPIIPIREIGVKIPPALLGNPQFINLDQNDRLGRVVQLMRALQRRNLRSVRLDPDDDELRAKLGGWRNKPEFKIRYRTQESEGLESDYRDAQLELVDQGFYLNVSDVPPKGLVEVEGLLNGQSQFGSGWVSADAVQVKVLSFGGEAMNIRQSQTYAGDDWWQWSVCCGCVTNSNCTIPKEGLPRRERKAAAVILGSAVNDFGLLQGLVARATASSIRRTVRPRRGPRL